MHSCPHVEAKRLHSADDGSAAPHGTRGTIECGEESVSGGVNLGSPVARQESADQSVMWLDEFTPCTITQSGYSLGRADQIGEEDGCENSFQLGFFLERGEELLKLSQHAFAISRERCVLLAGQFDDARVLQLLSDVSRLLDSLVRIVRSVHDERRNRHSLQ
jgi:hypothetical protein